MTWLSRAFVYGSGHGERPILGFLLLYAAAFLCYFWAVRAIPRISESRSLLLLVCLFAVLFRGIFLFSNPIQESDFYRYLWDGYVVAHGMNPYGVAPAAISNRETGTEAYVRLLETNPHFTTILARVNHPTVPTIYPPVAQGVFALASLLAPGSLLSLRLLFFACDLGVCAVLLVLLRHFGLNTAWIVVYAWSPLVVKETINSAHYDVVPTLCSLLAVMLMLRGHWLLGQGSLALAILGKLYPVVLVPFFVWRTRARHGWASVLYGLGVMLLVLGAGYWPFLSAGSGLWHGTATFAEEWQTNSFLFPLLQLLAPNRSVANVLVVVLLFGLLLVLMRRHDLRDLHDLHDLTDDRSFLWNNFAVLGAVLLLSPVADPWYFIWLAPLLCFFPRRAWLLLSGLFSLYYLSFYFMYRRETQAFRWVLWVEYLPFYGVLVYDWWKARSTHASASSTKSSIRFGF